MLSGAAAVVRLLLAIPLRECRRRVLQPGARQHGLLSSSARSAADSGVQKTTPLGLPTVWARPLSNFACSAPRAENARLLADVNFGECELLLYFCNFLRRGSRVAYFFY